MPSSYTSSLRLTLPQTGELVGTWGTTVNTGVTTLIDNAVAGSVTVTMTADTNLTLSTNNGATDQSRYMFINVSGGPHTLTTNVVCPAVSKMYVVTNNTSGSQSIVFKTSAGTGITVPNGGRAVLYCDGTNVTAVSTYGTNSSVVSSFEGSLALTGKLGVNVAAPVTDVDVAGADGSAVRVRATTNSVDMRMSVVGLTGNAGIVGTVSNHPLAFYTNNTEYMRLTAAGILQLSPTGGEGGQLNLLNSSGSTVGGTLDVSTTDVLRLWNGNNNSVIRIGQLGAGLTGGVIDFYTQNTERMRVTATGEVGIGTNTPVFGKLHVEGGNIFVNGGVAGGISTIVRNTDATAGSYSGLAFWNDQNPFGGYSASIAYFSNASATPNEFRISQNTSTAPLTFYVGLSERMRLTAAGNLGIGTTSPGSKLTVAGTIESTTGGVKYPDATTQTSAIGIAKAWAVINVTDWSPVTFTVLASSGIGTVTYVSGANNRFVVPFSSAFANANYARFWTLQFQEPGGYEVTELSGSYVSTASTFYFTLENSSGNLPTVTPQRINLVFFGS